MFQEKNEMVLKYDIVISMYSKCKMVGTVLFIFVYRQYKHEYTGQAATHDQDTMTTKVSTDNYV